jgi:hypothetical protein
MTAVPDCTYLAVLLQQAHGVFVLFNRILKELRCFEIAVTKDKQPATP